jgi:hypothetical protein
MSPDLLHTATSQDARVPRQEGRRNSPLKAGALKAVASLKAGALKAAVEGGRVEGRRASDHGGDNNQTGIYGTLDGGRE